MAAPRNWVDSIDNVAGLGHGRPAIPGYGTVKQITARDLDCPEPRCQASRGEACTGPGSMVPGKRGPIPVLHRSRIELALTLRDSGELEVTVVELPSRCRVCAQMGACQQHRCERPSCRQVKESASSFCADHGTGRGARPKMTEAKIVRMQELRAGGWTQIRIAAELGVSTATLTRYYKLSAEH
jgi:hypothetical protein